MRSNERIDGDLCIDLQRQVGVILFPLGKSLVNFVSSFPILFFFPSLINETKGVLIS